MSDRPTLAELLATYWRGWLPNTDVPDVDELAAWLEARSVTVRGSAPQEFSDPEHPTFHQCGGKLRAGTVADCKYANHEHDTQVRGSGPIVRDVPPVTRDELHDFQRQCVHGYLDFEKAHAWFAKYADTLIRCAVVERGSVDEATYHRLAGHGSVEGAPRPGELRTVCAACGAPVSIVDNGPRYAPSSASDALYHAACEFVDAKDAVQRERLVPPWPRYEAAKLRWAAALDTYLLSVRAALPPEGAPRDGLEREVRAVFAREYAQAERDMETSTYLAWLDGLALEVCDIVARAARPTGSPE